MKPFMLNSIGALGLSLGLVCTLNARAQGTAFTYQGRLHAGGLPYTGLAEFQFSLWNAASAGSQLGSTLTLSGVGVTNGLFAVTLDFGDQFPGADRWLEIAVRTNAAASFSTLSPRQKLTATPYYAVTAGNVTGTLSASQLSGTIPSGALGNAWQIGGNAGTTAGTHFLGTSDDQPLELKVNGVRALRLEMNASGAPNVIGGSPANSVAAGVVGATIGGGGEPGAPNQVQGDYGTVGGGGQNTASGGYSTVGGGGENTASGLASTVGGGGQNTASGSYSTVGGGVDNTASGGSSTVGGGWQNTASGDFATVPGGRFNSATSYAFAAGRRAKANHTGAFVWADSTDADFASTANDQFLIRAAGGVGIGTNYPRAPLHVRGGGSGDMPQGWFDRPDTTDYVRLRLTLGGNYNTRWDLYATNTVFGIWSGQYGEMLRLENSGLYVRGTFVSSSDRAGKRDFEAVDVGEVLRKVVGLPLSYWRYLGSEGGGRHLGPTAQDFRAAFGLGDSERGIAMVDADGVALAAIQGLNQKVEDEVTRLRSENAALRRELLELKELIRSQIAHGQGGAQ